MFDWKSHSNAGEQFEMGAGWTFTKWLGSALVASSLVACGGGSDSDDSGSTAGGGDDKFGAMSVRELPPATLDSEETAVMLAPGSLFFQTVGMTQGVVASFDPTAAYDQVQHDTVCDISGQIKVLATDLGDPGSPYTGELFNITTTDDQECLNGDDVLDSGLRVYTDGVRAMGRPQAGVGAVGDSDAFIAYEQSGSSQSDPYSVVMSMDGERMFGWARLWSGHVKLLRGTDVDSAMGDGGGLSRLYQLSQVVSGEGDSEMQYFLQIGLSDDPLLYQYRVAAGGAPAEAHTESYAGVYGWQWGSISGQAVSASCPGGRVEASAVDIEVRALPEGDDGIVAKSDEVWAGTVTLDDEDGNRAIVTYDGNLDTVSVSLNGGLAKTFTYDEINNLFMDRCFSGM